MLQAVTTVSRVDEGLPACVSLLAPAGLVRVREVYAPPLAGHSCWLPSCCIAGAAAGAKQYTTCERASTRFLILFLLYSVQITEAHACSFTSSEANKAKGTFAADPAPAELLTTRLRMADEKKSLIAVVPVSEAQIGEDKHAAYAAKGAAQVRMPCQVALRHMNDYLLSAEVDNKAGIWKIRRQRVALCALRTSLR